MGLNVLCALSCFERACCPASGLSSLPRQTQGFISTQQWQGSRPTEFMPVADDPVFAATCEPFVVRNAARHWPALHLWTLDHLARAHGHCTGTVRLSPSLHFPFVTPSLAGACVALHGVAAPPSSTRQVCFCSSSYNLEAYAAVTRPPLLSLLCLDCLDQRKPLCAG